jgi:hypothetical protein
MNHGYQNGRRVFLFSAAAALLPWSSRAAVQQSFAYQNPIRGLRARYCQIVRMQEAYYVTGTFPPF